MELFMAAGSCYVPAASRGYSLRRLRLEGRGRMTRTRGSAAAARPGGRRPAFPPRPAGFVLARIGRPCLLAILALSGVAGGASPAQAGNDFGTRPYVRLGLGQALYPNDAAPGIDLLSPSGQPLVDVTFGFDLSKYWGIEFGVDYNKTDIRSTTQGTLGDFSTIMGSLAVRLRYPSESGRFF